MDIKTSKSIFAKLLAQEDLKVHHAKVQTASFDTKTRTLTLPIWTDMDGDLYDLLCGHEVGHALHTPAKGWHDAICGVDGDIKKADMVMKGFLNILEDARIEKKIKAKYPGLRANFYRAYQGLNERDFFGIKDKSVQEMLLIDRINLHFKLGAFIAVPFTDAEKVYVRRVEQLETWEQVEALARELMAACKKELEEKQEQIKKKLIIKAGLGEMGEGGEGGEPIDLDDYDEIEYEFGDEFDAEADDSLTEEEKELLKMKAPIAETDRAFREHEAALLDQSSRAYEYMTLPTINSDKFILGYKEVMKMEFEGNQENYRDETYAAFRKKNDSVINYLVKEFELRRNAEQLARAKVSKSGELDVKKIFSYRYNEDLFRRVTTVPNGKNHGLLMFFDMSGSMTTQMGAAIEQMLVLVEFCRKVNIPFEVYGFTNGDHPNTTYYQGLESRQTPTVGDVAVFDMNFYLRQYFSDRMRPAEYKKQVSNMTLLARVWRKRGSRYLRRIEDPHFDPIDMKIPNNEDLNGTPLNQSIMLSIDIYNKFVARTKAEVVNMAFMTDGDTDDKIHYVADYYYDDWRKEYRNRTHLMADPDRQNVILTHKETRKSVKLAPNDRRGTHGLVKLVREVTGANVVCFDIVESQGRRVIGHKMFAGERNWSSAHYAEADAAYKKFKKDRIFIIDNLGFNEYYLIPGGTGMDIDDDDMDVEDGADKKKIFKAFAEMQDNKKTSRILLNRFIKMIA